MSSTKSRKNLTFSQKLEILKEGEKSSQRAVAAKFGVSLGVVNRVIKRKLELETLAENNCNHAAKRVKKAPKRQTSYQGTPPYKEHFSAVRKVFPNWRFYCI